MDSYLLSLCLIQGITEFLPVSSSGHLKLLSFIGGSSPPSLEWEVALHLGTLLAVLIYFWQEMKTMLGGMFRLIVSIPRFGFSNNIHLNPKINPEGRVALYLSVATLPALLVGYLVKPYLSGLSTPLVIGTSSILFGILLGLTDLYATPYSQPLSFKKAFLIGCAQTLAFIPGASRLGTCITAARFLELGRVEATSFAFLLSIPTVLAAVVLVGYDLIKQESPLDLPALLLAIGLTAIIGLAVIHGVLKFLERYTFKSFMIYRILLGIVLIGLSFFS